MPRFPRHFVPALLLALVTTAPAAAQYRRQVEQLSPAFAVTGSVGVLFDYSETMNPVETPLPEENRRGLREVGTSPWVSVGARYGRGIAIYGSIGAAFPGDADLSGADPLTGASLEGTDDAGLITIYSVGASFIPLRDVMGLRIDLGPTWMDLGEGGSYLAVHVSAAAKFLEIGDRGGVLLAWDGFFAGGQHDRDGVEYQVRGGRMSGVRAGFEMAF